MSKGYRTIADACNSLFATNYKGSPGSSWFKPNTFKGKLNNYKVWFPQLKPNHAGWVNNLVNDEITSKNANKKGKAKVGQKNITFPKTGNEYIFAGIFELYCIDANGTEHWKKIDNKCPVINKFNPNPNK